ncbi:hypothetical protein TrRE_jg5552 [Triparma retinervis]|uniref:Uncharacterized protein n=1 Tax=Triparma retinervis TaxID=2557542 RepID=A0A9W7AM66_9STRA|nr:hypothetical protein TrRE_jg5552 [Triparma retinervis]
MNDDRRLWYERIKQAISANKSIPVVSRSAWDWANGVYHSRGSPIPNNYGPKSNSQFYRSYGFVLPSNPHDTYSLALSFLSPSSKRKVTLGPFDVRRSGTGRQFPPGIFKAMDDPVGYHARLLSGGRGGGAEGKDGGGEVEIYQDTLRELMEVLSKRMGPFESSRGRDDGAAAGGGEGREGYVRWCKAVYRVGQREVLEDALETLGIMLGGKEEEEEEEEEKEEKEEEEEEEEGRTEKKTRRETAVIDQTTFDYQRCLSMMTFGGIYNGFINLYVYNLYSLYFPPLLRSTPALFGISATLVDNFLHVPLFYTPGFYYITGLVQGQRPREINATLGNGYLESMVTCWAVWVPVQYVNFALVPKGSPQLHPASGRDTIV